MHVSHADKHFHFICDRLIFYTLFMHGTRLHLISFLQQIFSFLFVETSRPPPQPPATLEVALLAMAPHKISIHEVTQVKVADFKVTKFKVAGGRGVPVKISLKNWTRAEACQRRSRLIFATVDDEPSRNNPDHQKICECDVITSTCETDTRTTRIASTSC